MGVDCFAVGAYKYLGLIRVQRGQVDPLGASVQSGDSKASILPGWSRLRDAVRSARGQHGDPVARER